MGEFGPIFYILILIEFLRNAFLSIPRGVNGIACGSASIYGDGVELGGARLLAAASLTTVVTNESFPASELLLVVF